MQESAAGVQTRPFLSTAFAGLPASPGASTQAPFRIVYYFISATCYRAVWIRVRTYGRTKKHYGTGRNEEMWEKRVETFAFVVIELNYIALLANVQRRDNENDSKREKFR